MREVLIVAGVIVCAQFAMHGARIAANGIANLEKNKRDEFFRAESPTESERLQLQHGGVLQSEADEGFEVTLDEMQVGPR